MLETSQFTFNPFKWPIMCSTGLLTIIQYVFFSFMAFLFFPYSFDPFNNFLSHLGNYDLNPNGAIFYFLAIIFSGILTILFYWNFYRQYSTDSSSPLLISILILGIANGISIFMSGVFAESVNYPLHFTFSLLIFLTLLPLLITMNLFFWKTEKFPRIISIVGLFVITIDFVFILLAMFGGDLFSDAAIMEWLSIASYFIWMIMIIIQVLKE